MMRQSKYILGLIVAAMIGTLSKVRTVSENNTEKRILFIFINLVRKILSKQYKYRTIDK